MKIVTYDPITHYRQVADLWERTLGDCYPVSERVLWPRIVSRPTYEPGDGVAAVVEGKVAGFGIVELDRAPLGDRRSASIQALLVDPAYQRRRIGSAMLTLLENTRLVAEGAGAAGLAGAWKRRADLAGKTVAVIVSGGNVTLDGLAEAMKEERAW